MDPVYRHIIRYLLLGLGINLGIALLALVLAPIFSIAYFYTMATFTPGLLIGAFIAPRFGTNAAGAIYVGAGAGFITAPLGAITFNAILANTVDGFSSGGFSAATWLWALGPLLSMVLLVIIDKARDRKKERAKV